MRDTSESTRPSMRTFLVERYWPGIDEQGAWSVVAALEARAREMSANGAAVSHVGSILMPADEVVFSLISAPDEAAVRALNEGANAPLDRIATAIVIGLEPGTGMESRSGGEGES
jgi:hypothetical protein